MLSSHGAVLFYAALNPACTRSEIAEALGLTERTVWSLIRDLRQVDALHTQNEGRRYRFAVNLNAPLRHPVLKGYALRTVLGGLVKPVEHSPRATSSSTY